MRIRDPIVCGDWPARRMRVFCTPTDWLVRRHDGENRVPCCRPSLEERREFPGATLSEPGLTRPLRCLVVKPKRALQLNRSA